MTNQSPRLLKNWVFKKSCIVVHLKVTIFLGIFNDGTELRISNIRHEDIGDYTCIARNGEGQISHTARVIIAGGAVIMVSIFF